MLKGNRRELRGQAMEVIGTGVALGAPVMKSFNTAVDFQDQTCDIAITGGFNPAQEQRLSMAEIGASLQIARRGAGSNMRPPITTKTSFRNSPRQRHSRPLKRPASI